MRNTFTFRLLLLALGTSFALTSCFDDNCKKNDPKPRCPSKSTTTATSSGNN